MVKRILVAVGLLGYRPNGPESAARQITRTQPARLIVIALLGGMAVTAFLARPLLGFPDLGAAGVAALSSVAFVALVPVRALHPAHFHSLTALVLVPWALAVFALSDRGGVLAIELVFVGPLILFASEGALVRFVQLVLVALVVLSLVVLIDSTVTRLALAVGFVSALALGEITRLIWKTAESQGAMLEQLVRRDHLTEVGNRRLLDERLEYELGRHARTRSLLTLLVIDLNGFKQVNDTLGHAAGDALLKAVGGALVACLRAKDSVVRLGGDEFCILAPETSAADAATVVEQVRRALATMATPTGPLTAAIGLATYPLDGTEAATLFAVADERQRHGKPRSLLGTVRESSLQTHALPSVFAPGAALNPHGTAPMVEGEQVPLSQAISRQPDFRAVLAGVFLVASLLLVVVAQSIERPGLAYVLPVVLLMALVMRVLPTERMPASLFSLAPPLVFLVIAVVVAAAGSVWFIVAPAFSLAAASIGFFIQTRRARTAHTVLGSLVVALPLVYGPMTPVAIATVAVTLLAVWVMVPYVSVSWRWVEVQARQLARLMRHDPLTGAGTRQLLMERMDYEITRQTRARRSFALVVLDLNGFKRINDTLGHAAGDELLKAVATALRSAVREQDTVVRQGGDEFAILAPEAGKPDADEIVRRVREALAEVDAGDCSVAGSVGVAVFPDDAQERDELFEIADARQLADKRPSGVSRPSE